MGAMLRTRHALALLPILLAAAVPSAALGGNGRPVIKGEEVGYFGSASVTYRMSVFVYSNLGPSAGNQVTVCLRGTCERARGHSARLNWYSATFSTRGMRMGDWVRFTVRAADGAGASQLTVTKPLLCMHNNGSTPQT